MSGLTELHTFVGDFESLAESFDLLLRANSKWNEEEWSWWNAFGYGLAYANFSLNVVKTVYDGEKLIDVIVESKPKPVTRKKKANFGFQDIFDQAVFGTQKGGTRFSL